MDKNSMKNALLIILSLFLLTACKHDIPFAYKMDIQQGNMLEPEDVEQIKVGMSKAQVDHILGMPISRDTFKQDRWDYVYSLKKNHEPIEQRHLTLYFDRQGLVERIEI
jgi:outer membrane protein assembly factor BamE